MTIGSPWTGAMPCPHCGVHSVFSNLAAYSGNTWEGILECIQCKGHMYLVLNGGVIQDYYPKRTYQPDPAIPVEVAKDMAEASKCLDAGAPRACATACRRAVQSVAVALGAAGSTLYQQIEDLAKNHKITPALQEWAHEVRAIGKVGAHADIPDDVSLTDATDAFNFLLELVKYVYIMPAEIAKRRSATNP